MLMSCPPGGLHEEGLAVTVYLECLADAPDAAGLVVTVNNRLVDFSVRRQGIGRNVLCIPRAPVRASVVSRGLHRGRAWL